MTVKAPPNPAVEELVALGEQLHGAHWIGPTARDLGVAHRTVAAWASGRSRFREGPVLEALRILVEAHTEAVERAREIAKPPGRSS